MDQINLPEFMNTEEKYNKMIHEIDSLNKFEKIFLKLLDDETLEMSSIMTIMKVIERDVILVNKLTEVSTLMEMTESFIRYMMLINKSDPSKNDDENKADTQPKQQQKVLKKIVREVPKKKKKKEAKKLAQQQHTENKKPNLDHEAVIDSHGIGKWECDC